MTFYKINKLIRNIFIIYKVQSNEKIIKDEESIEMEDVTVETFGSDFISVAKENRKELDFEFGSKFILFNDNYDEYESKQIESMKRKLANSHQTSGNEYKVNQMSIRYRPTNKNRPKIKKSAANKKKLLNNLEKNKFRTQKK